MAAGGRFVRIRVTDTGLGMEEQALPHLFEPFFTPNPPAARGKGLTMSSVYGVVKQSGGFIWAESRVNKGTSVTILLPPLEPSTRRQQTRAIPKSPLGRPSACCWSRIQMPFGRRSRECWSGTVSRSPPQAPRKRRSSSPERSASTCLLTDVALPGHSGPELATRFQRGLARNSGHLHVRLQRQLHRPPRPRHTAVVPSEAVSRADVGRPDPRNARVGPGSGGQRPGRFRQLRHRLAAAPPRASTAVGSFLGNRHRRIIDG